MIRNAKSQKDLDACYEILYNNCKDMVVPEFEMTESSTRMMLSRLRNTNPYFRVLEIDGKVVAFASASVMPPVIYSPTRALFMNFYQTSLRGRRAVMTLLQIHEDFLDMARELKLDVAVTTSEMPNKEVFYKVLALDGWTRHRSLAVKSTAVASAGSTFWRS